MPPELYGNSTPVSVFDEENTLALEVMGGHLNSILKGTEVSKPIYFPLVTEGVTSALPKWRQREQINPPSSAARMGFTEPKQIQK